MYYVNVERGVKLAVYDLNPAGKKTVFLVHGWPLNHMMFEYQFDLLPKLGFRCISIDLRGFGNSDAPWNGYDYGRLADDLYEVIRMIGVSEMTLVGFSMGGAIVIRYMSRYKEYKISKLALLSAAAPCFVSREGCPGGLPLEQVNSLVAQISRNRPQAIYDFGQNFFAQPVTPPFAEWFRSVTLSGPGYSTLKTAETLRDADLRADLEQITVPTGIFYGVLDKICPKELPLTLNRKIRNSKLFPFEQSGHAVFYDELEKFNQEFSSFLTS
ncbi:Arylesterase [Caprobacter fermentans]|uniref:Alpha/beta hydrolase n=1 Tax=Caproicibacter fermentans TaxID=2576756 RepID=A0A6N8I4H6_9FIRM|nr:alpha/beta hydrolase [Caproicibacter fermentans]MVB13031.1 Arylesterase [Caproicibacter fermentans]QNK41294.1 alpha/beta hydrolase [Caproicibacter fermentans]